MVKVTFYNLLRSKYNIEEVYVREGSINNIIDQIIELHPTMVIAEFTSAVVFYEGKPIHNYRFDTFIKDNEEIIITHFVGGG